MRNVLYKNTDTHSILTILLVISACLLDGRSLYGAEEPIVLFSNEENSDLVEYSTTDFFSAAVLAEARLRLQEIEVSYKVPIRLAFGGFHITTYEMGIPYEQSNSLLATSESIDARVLRSQIVQEKGGKLMGQMTQALRADHINGQEAAAWLLFSSNLYPFTERRSLNYLSKEVLLNGNVSSDIQTLLRSVAPTLKFFSGNGLEKNDAFLLEVIGLLEKALLEEEENIELALMSVEFLGDFPIEDVASPEWSKKDNTTASGPLCYKRGDQVLVKPGFRLGGVSNGTRIRATINNETFEGVGSYLGGLLTTTGPIATITLPNAVDLIPVLTIRWEVMVDGRWVLVEVTQHKVYVVFQQPLASINERVLYYSVTQGKGATTEDDLIEKLWAPFQNHQVFINMFIPEAPPFQLTYYKNIEPNYTGIQIVTSYKEGNSLDGECGVFSRLYEKVLLNMGIWCKVVEVKTIKGNGDGFLVKNWEFNSSNNLDPTQYDGFTHFNQIQVEWKDVAPGGIGTIGEDDLPNQLKLPIEKKPIANIRRPGHKYGWIGSPGVEDLIGVRAHSIANPYADFDSHYLVMVNSELYDPSYGGYYKTLKDWEEESVEGFYKFIQDNNNSRYYYYFIKNNPYEIETEIR